jgi:hypothetical protein
MGSWESRSKSRLKGEVKALERKRNQAYRNGEDMSGADLARLRQVRGRIEKCNFQETDEDYQD